MSASYVRPVATTAVAVVAFLFVSVGSAKAAPPACVTPPAQTTVVDLPLELYAWTFCADPDAEPLTFAISAAPAHGTAQVFGGFLEYRPEPGFLGDDGFSFTASDGTSTTPPVAVTVSVAENQPPVCASPVSLEAEPGTTTSLFAGAFCDDEGSFLDFEVVDEPEHGMVEWDDPFYAFRYTPNAGYQGPDAFTLVASDHAGAESDPILVDVTVLGPNHAPTCVTPITVVLPVGGRRELDHRTTCSDPDGDATFPELLVAPAHGRLELGPTGVVTYVADPGYSGNDRLVYRVRDRRDGISNDAVVDFVIGDPPPIPQPPDRTPPVLDLARLGGQKLGAVRRRGLKLRVTTNEPGTATVEAAVSRRTARRLRIDRRATGPVIVGRLTKVLVAGDNRVTVRLSKGARQRLDSARRVTLLVSVGIRDQAGNAGRDTLQLILRR